jgi:hypothetical protein
MSGETCTCGDKFRSAEDFRDHMPCPGSEAERAFERGQRDMLAEVIAALRNPMDYEGSLTMEVANGLDWAADYLAKKFAKKVTWIPWDEAHNVLAKYKKDCSFCEKPAVTTACADSGSTFATIRSCEDSKCRALAERLALGSVQ